MQPILRTYGTVSGLDVSHKLLQHMQVNAPAEISEATVDLMVGIHNGVDKALAEGRLVLDQRGPAIVEQALAAITSVDALMRIARELAPGLGPIGPHEIKDTPSVIRHALAKNLGPKLAKAMRKWENQGMFDIPEIQKI